MSQHDDFWKIAWDEGRTRFHQAEVNPALTNYFSPDPDKNQTCLVPLCGKSKDGNIYRSEKIDLFLGDFINQQTPQFEKYDFIYDRASMVAIEEKYRPAYVERIQKYMHEKTILHLVTFERETLGGGPPFDITD